VEIKNKIYFKNIDVLRFSAFFLICVNHLFFSNNEIISSSLSLFHKYLFPYGYVGLGFFFTLSSFINTWVILKEYGSSNKFNLKNFYARRILRIWPLYFGIVAIAYIVLPFISGVLNTTPPNLPSVWWFLTFTFDYYLGYINQNTVFFLAFLWSIAIEEQFYFVWGVFMRFFHKNIPAIAFTLMVVYILCLVLNAFHVIRLVYFNPINYFPNFAFGAFLAHSCFNKNKLFNILKNSPPYFLKIFYALLIITFLFLQKQEVTNFVHAVRHVVFTVFFCLLLFDQCFNTAPLFSMGKYNVLNYLGKISFGLYCWHGVVITIVKKFAELVHYNETYWDVLVLYPLLTLFLTIIISIISYELIEVKFLKLKERFSSSFSV